METDNHGSETGQNTVHDDSLFGCSESPPRKITIAGREFILPRSRRTRILIGVSLTMLGCLGFLPILGFWMIPLGLLVLSYEFARIRRWRRRLIVWRGRRRRNRET